MLHLLRWLDSPRSLDGAKLLNRADPVAAVAGTGPMGKDQPSRQESRTPAARTRARVHAHARTHEPHAKPDMTIALLIACPSYCGAPRVRETSAPVAPDLSTRPQPGFSILGGLVPLRGAGDQLLRAMTGARAPGPPRLVAPSPSYGATAPVVVLKGSPLGVTPRLGRTPCSGCRPVQAGRLF